MVDHVRDCLDVTNEKMLEEFQKNCRKCENAIFSWSLQDDLGGATMLQ
jgi:hypothetical protein